jgi:hypothetical protein
MQDLSLLALSLQRFAQNRILHQVLSLLLRHGTPAPHRKRAMRVVYTQKKEVEACVVKCLKSALRLCAVLLGIYFAMVGAMALCGVL